MKRGLWAPETEINLPQPVFIAGLPRSGTTLVHFLVGMHPQCIALGEVIGYLENPRRAKCSCGEWDDECSFWSGVKERSYDAVRQRVEEVYGPDKIMVDSSKTPAAKQLLGDARVLYCIRDVRAWTLSRRDQGVINYLKWHRWNQRDLAQLPGALVVSYDELVLRLDSSRRRIMDFLGLEYLSDTNFAQAEHHAIHANRMKSQPAKMANVDYDHRWVYSSPHWPAALLPQVMKYNSKMVYGLTENIYELASDDPRLYNRQKDQTQP